jgi:hypothetical protein
MEDKKMIFKTRFIYGESHIYPGCPKSEALFYLLRRGRLETHELPWVGKMGFEIELIGDTKEISEQMDKKELAYQKIAPGKLKMEAKNILNTYRGRDV